ncbi:MAG: Uma2 family endonuclease [Gemmataceae bacterium]|nr:Uma2 family endonuclease [Gemmataceae bacterium]
MSTAVAGPTTRTTGRNPGLDAVCGLFASDWSPWQVVLYGLTWADYDRLLDARAAAGRKRVKIIYDRGMAEIYTPGGGSPRPDPVADPEGTAVTVGNRHERWKKLLARLLEAAALGFRAPLVGCGNVTLSRADLDRGLEPDECYYVRNAAAACAVRELDLRADPPPDLVVEIESTRTVADRLELYAALGVPEVWRYDGDRLRILLRAAGGAYVDAPAGLAFPRLTADLLGGYLARAGTVDDTARCLELFDWARALPPAPPPA